MHLRRLLWRVASVLASVALLAASARPVLACEMTRAPQPGPRAALHAASHAHHAMGESAPAPSPAQPDHHAPACDHLAGCALMVGVAAPTIVASPVIEADATPRTLASRVDAPAPALEPPPPKA